MRRLPRLVIAWGIGWMIYLIAAVLWDYDGFPSIILQPLSAAVVSTLCLGAVLLAGLLLRVRPFGQFWHSGRIRAGALVAACLVTMCFGSSVGLTGVYADPDTGRTFVALHPAAILLSYLLLLFTIAHWPKCEPGRLP